MGFEPCCENKTCNKVQHTKQCGKFEFPDLLHNIFRLHQKSRLMNYSIHHPAHKANYQIDFLYSYPLIKSPYHPSNPINHPKHPACQYPIQNHRSRNRKNLTSNPKHLSFQMNQYRDKKFYRKAIMLQIYFNYILYFLYFATIISYFCLI